MAPGCSTIEMPCRSKRYDFHLPAICMLLTLSIHVGAAQVGAAISLGELGLDRSSTGRSLLAQIPGTTPGATRNSQEDGMALLEIKDSILSDPHNITFWWKPQGKKHAVNPCKTRNGTNQFWPGIDCANKRVIAIDLSNASLNGTLSPSLGRLAFLMHLNLSNNLLFGEIPPQLGMAAGLETLDLGNNYLEGPVPPTVGELRNLTSFLVGNNRLGGVIPPSLGYLRSLATLNMSENNLTGVIPPALNSCSFLNVVDLSGNGLLQGIVPFRNLQNLTVLHLQNNQLEGDFVANLGTFPQLQDLDLSNNNLDGGIPTTIGTLPLRSQLSLARNKLTGTIPEELGDLALVEKIDLSANLLTGRLPDSLNALVSLHELDISSNRLSDAFPRNLEFMNTSAYALQTFNASHNGFNGSLPALAGISTLQVFDASFNNLTGSITTSSVNFSVSSALAYFNVSNNNLTGEVPLFDDKANVNGKSFLNNPGLCGVKVGRNCVSASSESSKAKIVSISVGCSVALVAFLALGGLIFRRRGTGEKGRSSATVSAELDMKLTPEDILRMTQNFSDSNVIGVGSMSTVYRGVLADATVVAVKRFGIRRGEIDEGGEKVLADGFETLSVVRHWAPVKVLAYCCSPDIKALVSEYLPNGTLTNLLYPPLDSEFVREFDWNHRFNVAIIVAEGLKYLHHDCQPSTVHGDLKPSNILFNTFMEARIADFGLAKILAHHGLSVGTSGYKAPETIVTPGVTIKSDIYSFGVIVLQMITGRNPQTLELGQRLPAWIRATVQSSKSLQSILDPILLRDLRSEQHRIAMVLGVALLCTRDDPKDRPYITEVLKMLNHIKTRPQDGTRGGRLSSRRLRTSLSTHQRNEEIRQEVPGIDIARSPPPTPSALPANPSLSHWTPGPENR